MVRRKVLNSLSMVRQEGIEKFVSVFDGPSKNFQLRFQRNLTVLIEGVSDYFGPSLVDSQSVLTETPFFKF